MEFLGQPRPNNTISQSKNKKGSLNMSRTWDRVPLSQLRQIRSALILPTRVPASRGGSLVFYQLIKTEKEA